MTTRRGTVAVAALAERGVFARAENRSAGERKSASSDSFPAARHPRGVAITSILRRDPKPRLYFLSAGAVRLETAGPNEIWPADFKGQFKTGDRGFEPLGDD